MIRGWVMAKINGWDYLYVYNTPGGRVFPIGMAERHELNKHDSKEIDLELFGVLHEVLHLGVIASVTGSLK
jgi:hypothetical protein